MISKLFTNYGSIQLFRKIFETKKQTQRTYKVQPIIDCDWSVRDVQQQRRDLVRDSFNQQVFNTFQQVFNSLQS